ncbi:MAG TPA: UDP-3-O-(3-hydroxymyristoyl)glucosamine N-acyltransferase, partial [Bryobacteraceae bacterium]|nr:UDP-3-O-(3-hydroxymyristoyl)glucosamine N-acyltransferase [Bryobacteraceae bacterium]
MDLTVEELASKLGCAWEGEGNRTLRGAAPLEVAEEDEVSFVANRKAAQEAGKSRAGCLIVPIDFEAKGRTVIRHANPRNAFARTLGFLFPDPAPQSGIHPTAVIAESALVGAESSVGPHVTVGDDARIGARCRIGAGCSIGRGVILGDDAILHPNVTIYAGSQIGSRVIVHAGAVIGADGFGFAFEGDHYEKFPQVGLVRIGNDVEIGANSCIDRAALGWTEIGDGTKLDNMVHIAHNCRIGRH